jgi:hypothetical protein
MNEGREGPDTKLEQRRTSTELRKDDKRAVRKFRRLVGTSGWGGAGSDGMANGLNLHSGFQVSGEKAGKSIIVRIGEAGQGAKFLTQAAALE